ncbi:3-hydroxyacyl-CoA dehydrogenase NAD-binding domain-containing protein [Nocardioides zeae]|uniref:3-hydroxyacyl-CoA dehydrogenase NAD-binding domain-containing protein n=1 Tax=Nocardioides imazamoxiresistens TaxID=3231893 RepID=A0ABU3Q104_9ACTN|nr:3-hydroxyacyl-CoA dehydrogenase NAD-binding domain-containing protein [Nocardioides zeae]MDT9595126.1 3-hydroxyacyl-CoA dehydrogenase NAD-binding domain-containing protein [Nocardioides zeae]
MTSGTNEQISATLVYPYLNHAVRMYEQAYASRGDVDAGMRFGCGYPVGPLAALDEIGLDVVRDALAARYAQTGDPLHRPAELLERLVGEGRTGKASGRGFYTYADGEVVADDETPTADDAPALRHEITRVGVVGTGTMAGGIVEVFAKAGYDVVYVGRSQDKLDAVVTQITRNQDRAIEKGRSDAATKDAILGRLTGATEREALGDVDLVVEAIAEDLDVKTELYRDLDRITKPGAILATTTSSLPITQLGAATKRPEAVIGMHFFNPAPVMKLVEVVTTDQTSPEVDETVRALCASVGKVAVSCGDRSGFIVNALLFPYLNDAVLLAEAGEHQLVEIDAAIKAQVGLPMGPFELLDVVGTDVSLAIQKELHAEFGEPGLKPAATLESLVAQGRLGRKTGAGFHEYA